MSALTPFDFEGATVRVVEIDGKPWFVAKDVAVVLEFRDAHNAVRILEEDERGTHIMSTPGGPQNLLIVSESGLYALIFKSRKPEARTFRKWVTSKVLPAIRKTGFYEDRPKLPPHFQAIQDLVLQAAEQERRLTSVEVGQARIETKLSELDGDTGYMTVIAFCRSHGLHLPLSQASALGRKAGKLCRERGFHIGSIPDERFGRVNSYPIPVLQEAAELEGREAS